MRLWRWLLGLPSEGGVEQISLAWGSPRALGGPALWLACVVAAAAIVWWYYRGQTDQRARRMTLLGLRTAAIVLILTSLLDPQLRGIARTPRPGLVYWLLDNTASMTLVDNLPEAQRLELDQLSGWNERTAASRLDHLRGWWSAVGSTLVDELRDTHGTRSTLYLLGERSGAAVVPIDDPARIDSKLWSGDAEMTPLGDALEYLLSRAPGGVPDAVVVVSDFAHNHGTSPLDVIDRGDPSAGRADGQPSPRIFTVGLGPVTAVDLEVAIVPPSRLRRAERAQVEVVVTQHGLDGKLVDLSLRFGDIDGPASEVARHRMRLDQHREYVPLEFSPPAAGYKQLVASIDVLPEESSGANNSARQMVTVVDDFLRIGFVAHEPTWEWRFVKEVFHRDPLVGLRGFRTYLQSSAVRVRETNPLFLPGLVRPRGEFFATDVVILGDMPAAGISPRFAELLSEFVRDFGGGLVVMSGPRFGPPSLADTPLAELLPVSFAPVTRRTDTEPFSWQLTAEGARSSFMRLGPTGADPQQIWNIADGMMWYYPVEQVDPLATVLAVHPEHRCSDGQRQPMVVTRPFGRGQVVYLANDEIWRLRREHGERYYRQFWSQLLNNLSLGHPLGESKRFQLFADPAEAATDEPVSLSLRAYDTDYRPWKVEVGQSPEFELAVQPLTGTNADTELHAQPDAWTVVGDGQFEAQVRVPAPGVYRAQVTDGDGRVVATADWRVFDRSPELRDPARNQQLQLRLAELSSGRAYELAEAQQLINDLPTSGRWERSPWQQSLWQSPMSFLLLAGLLATEWILRLRWNLR